MAECPICRGGPNGHTLNCPVLGLGRKDIELQANKEKTHELHRQAPAIAGNRRGHRDHAHRCVRFEGDELMAHTPGPWTIGANSSSYGISIWSDEHLADVKSNNRDERMANARLIAAAPELLAALKYVRRFLNVDDHETAYVDDAIAKAEGESNA